MALSATRDLLSVTSILLDKSDDIYEETKRVTKYVESRKAFNDMQEIQSIGQKGPDASNIRTLCCIPTVDTAPLTIALKGSLQNCNQAIQYLDDLQRHRASVVEARREALDQRQNDLNDKKETLQKEITVRMKTIDNDYLTQLRTIMTNNNSSSNSGSSTEEKSSKDNGNATITTNETTTE